MQYNTPFDFKNKDYGVGISSDSIGFNSNQIHLKIECERKEAYPNSCEGVMVCTVLQDGDTKKTNSYCQFKMNEKPSEECCAFEKIFYSLNIRSDFKKNDRFTVFIWNQKLKPFYVSKLSYQIYNYNFSIQ